jgi:hypothetical protein
MCLAVYLASDQPIPLIQWNNLEPSVSIQTLHERDRFVQNKFTYSNTYYVGSHEGCGCGFLKNWLEGEEFEEHQVNYSILANIIQKAVSQGSKAELFVCWEGDQDQLPIRSEEITVEELGNPAFEFEEKVYYRVIG